jgi:hypothetical protein
MSIDFILKQAKELIESGKIKSFPKTALIALKDNPEDLEEMLKEISEQANDDNSRKATIRIYGAELVGLAIAYRVSKKEAEEKENPKPTKIKTQVTEMLHTKLLAIARK